MKPPPLPSRVRTATPPPPTKQPPRLPAAPHHHRAGDYVPKTGAGIWLVRVVMTLVCAGSVWLGYWSLVVRLQPVNREYKEKTIELSRLADQVEQMKLKLQAAEAENIRERYETARQYLFAGADDLESWQAELRSQGILMTYEAAAAFGEQQPYPKAGDKLGFIPANLEFRPVDVIGMTNSPYKRLLGLMQTLARSPKRFDLLELVADGNSDSVREARAMVHLLADRKGEP
jgi:hypothetical protein